MIRPHGAETLRPLYVDDASKREQLIQEANTLLQIDISSATAGNLVMLASGYFTPLSGLMSKGDALSVAQSMTTLSGVFFPVPVLNLLPEARFNVGDRIALLDPNVDNNPVIAIQTVESIELLNEGEVEEILIKIFGTTDQSHPGVAAFVAQGRYVVSGQVEVLTYSYFPDLFGDTFKTAGDIRQFIEDAGWQRVVAFQTRNPMHRAHEELCKMAMQAFDADGLVIHMLLGKLKAGDIPADVRDRAIRVLSEQYFPADSVLISGYGFDMLYAGPREAVLHALFRQNMGATHFIVGRDHAGVGDFYGAFDAQTIFDEAVPDGALEIEIFKADHTAWSKKLNKVVMMRDVPDHTPEDFVLLSGTKVREMLSNGQSLPEEFSRAEVAQVLMDYYKLLS